MLITAGNWYNCINHGDQDFTISRGTRIAQAVIAPVLQIEWNETEELSDTVRGEGGFGSTGIVKKSVKLKISKEWLCYNISC